MPLDVFKFVVLGAKHVNVSYDSRVPKVIEGIIHDKAGSATGVKDSVIGVLDTWAIEIGSRIRTCVEWGAIDGLVSAFCSLMDDTIVD